MFSSRKIEDLKAFLKDLKESRNSNFKTMLINDKEHDLHIIVDKHYRNNLTSNLAESSFGILKRICSWTKQPLVMIVEIMMKRSIYYMLIQWIKQFKYHLYFEKL